MSINEFKNIKILFVEDEDSIRDNAISYLKKIFDEVYGANDAYEAFDIIQNRKPHIIITDINLPKINGLEMIKKIRQCDSNIKIIILSAYTNTEYLLDAVELGLEKYLVKPICHDILFTVLSSCVKKIKSIDENIKYFSKDCYFDVINKSLYKESNIIKLSNKELKFLTLLCEYSNRFVSYETIEYIVWNGDFMSEDALRTLARKIRKKIPKDCLENFSKVGYKIITL